MTAKKSGRSAFSSAPVCPEPLTPKKILTESEEEKEIQERLQKILNSPSYCRADCDFALLQREELRGARLQLEFLKPDLIFDENGVLATIVVFGGTRIVEKAKAKQKLAELLELIKKHPRDKSLKRQLNIAKRILAKSHYYDVAREFGRLVGQAGAGICDNRLIIITGGGPGLMEAANRGAYDVGAKSAGLNIFLPREQVPNPYITPELCFQFRYFGLRKMHFMMRAKAFVAFPGGYGTLDELFEALCLIQTGKIKPLPVILVGKRYWRRVFDADFMVAEGTIDPQDKDLFHFAETAEEIWNYIRHWYEQRGASLFP
ncbi:MAG: TIGR00730 family Rossman fold protein [Thermodesulfobacteriota bacterium]